MVAKDSKMDLSQLADTNGIKGVLEKLKTEQASLDKFMSNPTNYINQLAKGAKTGEQAYRWATEPGNGEHLEAAIEYFGEGSPEIAAVRKQALKTLMQGTIAKGMDGYGGKPLEEMLNSYSPEMRKQLFPRGMEDDLRVLAEKMTFAMPNITSKSIPALAAGGVLSAKHAFYQRWIAQGTAAVWRMVYQHPTMIRYLALGYKKGSLNHATSVATQDALRVLIINNAMRGPPDDDEPPP